MALINKWPQNKESFYDNKQWEAKSWTIGEPITKEKLQNLDDGIAVLATQMKAVLGEFNPSSLDGAQLNASRLDKVQEWITGSTSGTYSGTNVVSRLSAIDTLNTQQNNKLAAIISEIGGTGNDGTNTTYGGTSRIDSIATEVWGSNTVSGTSRIDKNDNRIAALANELGGGTPDGTSTTYPAAATRLDDLEKEIGGTRSAGNGYTNSRIDTLESTTSAHTTKLSAIATEVWGTDTTNGDSRIDKLTTELYGSNTTNYDSTSRLDSAITKLSTITTELYGSDNTSVTSRLDDLEKEIGGTRTSNSTGYSNSRIDTLESISTSYGTRLTNIETKNTAQDNKLTAIMSELGGTGNDGSNTTYGGISRLDSIITEVWGSNTTSGNSRLDSIETHNATVDKAIAAIKNELGGTYVENSGFTNSRIDSLEQKVGNGVIGTDSDISAAIRRLSDTVAGLDPTGSAEAISFLVSEVWGQTFSEDTDFTANSRIDNLETTTQNLGTTTQNLGTQLSTLATGQEELEQNLAATNTKIPIEMYVATNSSASDTIVLNAAPRDKSIFFIAIPQGTLGTNNLTLQTPDIQFNNVLINRIYNGSGMKIKYSAGSLISIYRNGANAYVYNVPMVL